jgi:hypothetical protein
MFAKREFEPIPPEVLYLSRQPAVAKDTFVKKKYSI